MTLESPGFEIWRLGRGFQVSLRGISRIHVLLGGRASQTISTHRLAIGPCVLPGEGHIDTAALVGLSGNRAVVAQVRRYGGLARTKEPTSNSGSADCPLG